MGTVISAEYHGVIAHFRNPGIAMPYEVCLQPAYECGFGENTTFERRLTEMGMSPRSDKIYKAFMEIFPVCNEVKDLLCRMYEGVWYPVMIDLKIEKDHPGDLFIKRFKFLSQREVDAFNAPKEYHVLFAPPSFKNEPTNEEENYIRNDVVILARKQENEEKFRLTASQIETLKNIVGSGRKENKEEKTMTEREAKKRQMIRDYQKRMRQDYIDTFSDPRLAIKDIFFNGPATIILWETGGKTVVKLKEGDTYDKEKAIAMAIAKRALGKRGFKKVFDRLEEEKRKLKKAQAHLEKLEKEYAQMSDRKKKHGHPAAKELEHKIKLSKQYISIREENIEKFS